MYLSTNLQYLRRLRRSMTQEDLAEAMDVTRQTVAKWESGAALPEIEKLLQLAEIFSCTVDQLLKDDMNKARDAYSPVRVESLPAFRMARYAVISPDPETDAIARVKSWREQHGLTDAPIIGWDFPFVSQEQINVFHMHGYAAACILLEDAPSPTDMEYAEQPAARYCVITIRSPMDAPFDLIPNAYHTVHSYMKINRLRGWRDERVLSCFEKEYESGGVWYMDVYITLDPLCK